MQAGRPFVVAKRRKMMGIYEVTLGVDHAARDTGRRVTMQVRERDPLSAAIKAEELADATLQDATEYTHAMRSVPLMQIAPAQRSPLALAA
jgi:hypothetical protein